MIVDLAGGVAVNGPELIVDSRGCCAPLLDAHVKEAPLLDAHVKERADGK